MLFANGVCERDLPRDSSMPSDLVMICQWASLFTQSMDSRMTKARKHERLFDMNEGSFGVPHVEERL
jgi:hypothetical protein